jgi:hypothetical protein
MSNKQKKDIASVDTPETPTEDIASVDTPAVDNDVLESDEQKAHREEVQNRTFVDGQFTVKANLKRNGKIYSVGDSITLDEDEAKALLADGTVA